VDPVTGEENDVLGSSVVQIACSSYQSETAAKQACRGALCASKGWWPLAANASCTEVTFKGSVGLVKGCGYICGEMAEGTVLAAWGVSRDFLLESVDTPIVVCVFGGGDLFAGEC
jgi:hypothetical protein